MDNYHKAFSVPFVDQTQASPFIHAMLPKNMAGDLCCPLFLIKAKIHSYENHPKAGRPLNLYAPTRQWFQIYFKKNAGPPT